MYVYSIRQIYTKELVVHLQAWSSFDILLSWEQIVNFAILISYTDTFSEIWTGSAILRGNREIIVFHDEPLRTLSIAPIMDTIAVTDRNFRHDH